MRRSLRLFAILIAAGAASACSHMAEIGSVLPNGASHAATPGLSPRERVRTAIELLDAGDERHARAELQAALEEQPNSSAARRLLDQISGDPRALLAGEAAPYIVRPGETMSALAERYQGDALLFYALARFNNIDAPNQVSAGQTLMIPRRPRLRIPSSVVSLPPVSEPQPGSASASSVRAPLPRSPNAVRANALRLQGLQFLNGGQVDRAVAVLRQAQALDGSNDAVQRDLDRAVRLQASLQTPSGAFR